MKTVKKVSQKRLCQIAKALCAIRLTQGGCYRYEAVLYDTYNLVEKLDLDIHEGYEGFIVKDKLYYCQGLYGNSGQLHYIKYLNSYGQECSCYVYYTDINYNDD